MKARIKKTGEIVDVEYDDDDLYVVLGRHQYLYANEFDVISEPEEEVMIEGFVARDEDGDLYIYRNKPFREDNYWTSYGDSSPLNNDLFPSVTWESEPLEVTITIKPKKK